MNGGENQAGEMPTGTLGVVGLTVNAMALIAPGAFLWITFAVQAACASTTGESYAKDMWCGIVLALIVAYSTAFPYAELARRYPEADCGGAYYFAAKGFQESTLSKSVAPFTRKIKLFVGWSSHLFYWVYPGVMTAFQATLVGFLIQYASGMDEFPSAAYPFISFTMSISVGFICFKGVTGSTMVSIIINVIQLSMLVITTSLFFHYRSANPSGIKDEEWVYSSTVDVITPKSFVGVLFQSSVAILILVGFDSATSMSGDAKNPAEDIPKAVVYSITIQGLFAYLFQYLGANAALSTRFTAVGDDGAILAGMDAAAALDAPIGDLAKLVVNEVMGSGGGAYMFILGLSVAIAVFGSTLAAMNTAVRFTQAMADDGEMPPTFCKISSNGTPTNGIIAQVIFTGLLGTVGSVGGVMTLTAVTLASNIGTFFLYTAVCLTTIVTFVGAEEGKTFRRIILPGIGILLNMLMVCSIFIIGLMSGGDTAQATMIAIFLAIVWMIVAMAYWKGVNDGARGNQIQKIACENQSNSGKSETVVFGQTTKVPLPPCEPHKLDVGAVPCYIAA